MIQTMCALRLLLLVNIMLVTGCVQKHDTDVEFVPTPQPVVVAMLKMAGVNRDDIVYDLGCGDGRFIFTAAKMFGARGVGVDLDPFLISRNNKYARKEGVTDRVKFIEGDLFQINLRKATVVTLYLTPELNLRLRPKLLQELKPGARIVSHDFTMGDWRPDNMGRLHNITYDYPDDRMFARDAPFYFWVTPANAAGIWRWTIATPAGSSIYSLRLTQKFQEIHGALSMRGKEMPVTDVRLIGDQLSFTVRDDSGRDKAVMWFTGSISDNTINGILEMQGGESTGNYDWTAKRTQ